MRFPLGLLAEMNEVVKEDNRAQRRAQAKARASKGRH